MRPNETSSKFDSKDQKSNEPQTDARNSLENSPKS